MFKAIGATLQALTNIIVALSRTTEKTVQLAENEVDMLQEEQKYRLATQRIELSSLMDQAQLERQQS
jgi:uncharacterized ferredoxin-like protein